jgi:hypothetical protein
MTKITKEQFAYMLDGRQCGEDISGHDDINAASSGLVVLFIYDNILYIRGKVLSTERCFNNSKIGFGLNNKVFNEFDTWFSDPMPIVDISCTQKDNETTIWQFKTKIPHATFNTYDGDEIYCEGMVIDYNDIYPDQY